MIRNLPAEQLQPIQAAAAGPMANIGDWLSREELLTLLARYCEDGVWAGDLGDLMPQLYASFTNSPLFVIVYDSDQKKIMGYFLSPSYVFNQPTFMAAPSPVICFQNHYEPLVVPEGFREAWEAIFNSHQTQELGMAAIQVHLTEEDLEGGDGERRAGATLTTAAGPSGIPGYPGIPGLNKNPDPGILENTIPGFFAIFYMEQNNDFKEFYWFLNKNFPKNPGMNMLG